MCLSIYESPAVFEGGLELPSGCDWILYDSPLDIAIENGWVGIVRFPLERGASLPSACTERYVPEDRLFFYDQPSAYREVPRGT